MPCALCSDTSLYYRLTRLADNIDERAALFGCPECGSLYKAYPEVKQPAVPVTEEEAHDLFPGDWAAPVKTIEALLRRLAEMLEAADEDRWHRSMVSLAARMHGARRTGRATGGHARLA